MAEIQTGKLDLGALYGGKATELSDTNQSQGKDQFFKPNPRRQKSKHYKAVVKFLHNTRDISNSIVWKYTCYVRDNANRGRYIDSPKTIGQDCKINETYWKFKNSPNALDQKLAERFSRSQQYYSLIQVIEDEQEPENVGKILIWKYGKKIYDKITAEETPQMKGVEAISPFNPVDGRLFLVNVNIVGEWPNYDQCQFVDFNGVKPGMRFYNEAGEVERIAQLDGSQEQAMSLAKEISAYIDANAPVLEDMQFQAWTREDEEWIDHCINDAFNRDSKPTNVTPQQGSNAKPAFATPQATVGSPVGNMYQQPVQQPSIQTVTPAQNVQPVQQTGTLANDHVPTSGNETISQTETNKIGGIDFDALLTDRMV